MPDTDPPIAFAPLLAGLDNAIGLARTDNWDELVVHEMDVLALLGRAEAWATSSPGGKTRATAAEIRLIVGKINELQALIAPRRQELSALIAGQNNSRKLRQTYGS